MPYIIRDTIMGRLRLLSLNLDLMLVCSVIGFAPLRRNRYSQGYKSPPGLSFTLVLRTSIKPGVYKWDRNFPRERRAGIKLEPNIRNMQICLLID